MTPYDWAFARLRGQVYPADKLNLPILVERSTENASWPGDSFPTRRSDNWSALILFTQ